MPKQREVVASAKANWWLIEILFNRWWNYPRSRVLLGIHNKFHTGISTRRFGAVHMDLDALFDSERLMLRPRDLILLAVAEQGGRSEA
jgi:hypothetical protein